MNFIYPYFLFALFTVAIPLIIHLFNFRSYKTLYFSNIAFLKHIKQQTKARSQLKHLLVLITRILFICSLVFAFAQPYLLNNEQNTISKQPVINIYIDNSFSMGGNGKNGNLLEIAKNNARAIVNAANGNTHFYFLTNDFLAKHQHLLTKEQILEYITETDISPESKKVSEIISKFNDYQYFNQDKKENNSDLNNTYLISDFQSVMCDISAISLKSNLNVFLIPIENQTNANISLDSCWFDSPFRAINQTEILNVKLSNRSANDIKDLSLQLKINDSLKAVGTVSVNKGNSAICNLSFSVATKGTFNGEVSISDYPITFDNNLFFNYKLNDTIHVLVVGKTNNRKVFEALFGNDDYVKLSFSDGNSFTVNKLMQYQTVIYNEISTFSSGAISNTTGYVESGGNLVVIPSLEADLKSYNELFNSLKTNYITGTDTTSGRIEKINYDHYFYKNSFLKKEKTADLPRIKTKFDFSKTTGINEDLLLTGAFGKKILSLTLLGKGKVYVFSISMDERFTNFCNHPLIVPTLYNMALFSQPENSLYYIIGQLKPIEIEMDQSFASEVLQLKGLKNKFELIPRMNRTSQPNIWKIDFLNSIKESGIYSLFDKQKKLRNISFNYSRTESELKYYSANIIEEEITKNKLKNIQIIDADTKVLAKKIEQINKGIQLWKYFIILALVLFLIEVLVLRFWK